MFFNIKINIQSVFVLLLLNIFLSAYGSKIYAGNGQDSSVFSDISLSSAKKRAATENKMIFVDFYADWCIPCKWMEETTLADDEVKSYLKDNYISIKIDIDDFDGFAIKEHYGIKVLPTILILDARGVVWERKEESLGSVGLMEVLKDQRQNVKIAKLNSSPTKKNKKYGHKSNSTQESKMSGVEAIDEGHATVETTYRVQVGVFTDYANTKNMVKEIKDISKEPVVVLNDNLYEKTVYKVLVGDFNDRHKANKFKNQLWQNYGIDGYVK